MTNETQGAEIAVELPFRVCAKIDDEIKELGAYADAQAAAEAAFALKGEHRIVSVWQVDEEGKQPPVRMLTYRLGVQTFPPLEPQQEPVPTIAPFLRYRSLATELQRSLRLGIIIGVGAIMLMLLGRGI
ncbi:MAG TPA: hypothetical protein VEH84_02565 [Alphaproteobacteria bacterium]|nr:hypothetical protein [Alphaproteobacteria bacterium]